jgi:ACS family sodium-dependent inorganic phosphate cotransporter
LSALPYLLALFYTTPVGRLADWLIKSEKLSRSKTRKIMTSIGFLGPGLAMLILTIIGCDPTLAIILLCLSAMLNGTALSGYNVNQLELTPNYAGTVSGATSTMANMCGFVTPAVVGALTKGQVLC